MTPGPWFEGRALSDGRRCIVGDGDSVVCLLPDERLGFTYVEDDARLIAAAPELLEALEVAHALIDPDMGVCPMGRKEASTLIAAAIAKAKGEQP